MRKAALAGLFACAIIVAMPSSEASASSLGSLDINKSTAVQFELAVLEVAKASIEDGQKPEDDSKPVVHTVQPNETLSDIGKRYDTSWKRLYFKNKHIEHPDVINVGDKLTIPEEDEKLKKRPIGTEQHTGSAGRSTSRTSARSSRPASSDRPVIRLGSSSGNRYTRGYCTWYVKNRRPDLPNNLGNAITWASRARAQGIPTGSKPRVGAVGQQGNHVVYLEKVHGNGTVTISEMNFKGWGIVNRRTVPASNFTYIY